MAQKRSSFGANIGGAFILVIFVLLCMTTFATLSLVSANADHRLTVKAVDAAVGYYTADAKAERLLAQIDALLQNCRRGAESEQHYRALCREELLLLPEVVLIGSDEQLLITYQLPAGDRQALDVSLQLLPLSSAARYERLHWQTVRTDEWIPDDSLGVWSGS